MWRKPDNEYTTNLFSIVVGNASNNTEWYHLCSPNGQIDSNYLWKWQTQLCDVTDNLNFSDTSLTKVALLVDNVADDSIATVPGNCSILGLERTRLFCHKGRY